MHPVVSLPLNNLGGGYDKDMYIKYLVIPAIILEDLGVQHGVNLEYF